MSIVDLEAIKRRLGSLIPKSFTSMPAREQLECEKDLDLLISEVERLQGIIKLGHRYLQEALGLHDAPRRFDFYAEKIDRLRELESLVRAACDDEWGLECVYGELIYEWVENNPVEG